MTQSLAQGLAQGLTPRVLLTGATGYVGGRLLARLQAQGCDVRCLVRRPDALSGRTRAAIAADAAAAAGRTTVVVGDLLAPQTLTAAFEGIDVAYYLVHSMGSAGDFEQRDRTAARNFAQAARRAGVRRVIYLGGLGRGDDLSRHLRSRHEVGDLLREHGPPVLELRASIVLGSGSLSFELIRALVERLPVMITPRWVEIEAQPIAINDLLAYLLRALTLPLPESRTFEIGGADRVSYGDLMREYARQRKLRRVMLKVPFLTPGLSSLWLGLVTPLFARVGRKLIESIRHPTVVEDDSAPAVFGIRPVGMSEAIAAAIRNEDREFAETRWFDALSSSGEAPDWTGRRFGNRLIDTRECESAVSAERAFAPIRRIGGDTGWYATGTLWRLRATLDLLAGGVGARRGRPPGDALAVGDAVDFWRVEAYEPGRLLRLRAEMRVPGRAWLEFEVRPSAGGSVIRQTASFDPLGLSGLAYWYLLYPLHALVFGGMLRGIARAGVRDAVRVGTRA